MFVIKVLYLAVLMVLLENFSVQASLSAEQKAALKAAGEPFVQECIKDFGFTEEQVEEFKKKHKPSEVDPCFISCFFKKSGLFDDKGMFDLDKGSEFLKKNINNEEDRAVLEKIQQECANVNDAEVTDGEKGCERAKMLFDCFKKHKHIGDDEKE